MKRILLSVLVLSLLALPVFAGGEQDAGEPDAMASAGFDWMSRSG